MNKILTEKQYLVLTGNYGSGKTELALNLAMQFARKYKTTLVDLDIVNPYFRSGEKAEEAEQVGIRMLMPTFAMTTVDIPALPAEISDRTIFDVGGDDTGAAALGRYYPSFIARRDQTAVMLVVNCMRPLTQNTEDIIDLAERIENRGRLKIDAIINNTNLADQTEPGMVEAGEKTVLECAERMGIRLVITAGKQEVLDRCSLVTPTLAVRRYMAPEWMES